MKVGQLVSVWCALHLAAASGWAAEISAAGASFPSKVYQKWAQTYQARAGDRVVYRATGSGDGIKQATARSVAFGGTDSALTADELAKRKLVQLPTLIGGIVPVVNLPGLGANRLQLSGEVLADLMAGKIQRWNDPRVVELNPGQALPSLKVRRVVRADKSGTTEGFTRYLAAVSPSFQAEVGTGPLPKWPGDVLADEGNDGVVKRLRETEGAVAYVSYDRVLNDELSAVKLRNASGRWVSASEAGFRAAILDSDLHRKGDDQATLMNRSGHDTWPITMASFVLVDAEPAKGDDIAPTLRFLYWVYQRGDDMTKGTGFAPLPIAVQTKLASRFETIRPKDGRAPSYVTF